MKLCGQSSPHMRSLASKEYFYGPQNSFCLSLADFSGGTASSKPLPSNILFISHHIKFNKIALQIINNFLKHWD